MPELRDQIVKKLKRMDLPGGLKVAVDQFNYEIQRQADLHRCQPVFVTADQIVTESFNAVLDDWLIQFKKNRDNVEKTLMSGGDPVYWTAMDGIHDLVAKHWQQCTYKPF